MVALYLGKASKQICMVRVKVFANESDSCDKMQKATDMMIKLGEMFAASKLTVDTIYQERDRMILELTGKIVPCTKKKGSTATSKKDADGAEGQKKEKAVKAKSRLTSKSASPKATKDAEPKSDTTPMKVKTGMKAMKVKTCMKRKPAADTATVVAAKRPAAAAAEDAEETEAASDDEEVGLHM